MFSSNINIYGYNFVIFVSIILMIYKPINNTASFTYIIYKGIPVA
jgi:hypothetical protein